MTPDSALAWRPTLGTAGTSARRRARIVGVLLITATTASLAGSALLGPVLGGTDYLGDIYTAQGRVLWGTLFSVLAAFTSAGVAIALYPLLRTYAPGLAMGSVGMRVIEASMYLVAALGPILLTVLAQQHAHSAAPQPYDQTLGALLKGLRDQAGILGALAAYLGAGMYYLVFHRTRLIPRWLSDWGLLGVMLGFLAGTLVVLDVTTFGSPFMVTMNLPFAVQEMVLAVWLLLRGFAQAADTGSGPIPQST
jgi:hypothetical protein